MYNISSYYSQKSKLIFSLNINKVKMKIQFYINKKNDKI